MNVTDTAGPLETLRHRFRGAVLEPGDERFERAAQAYNLALTQEPELVAIPSDEQDVVTIVDFARANGMQVAPQRTGHNAWPLGSLEGVILVRTDGLQGVEIDAQHRIARVRAGSTWADVVPQASELGLAALHGSTPGVSVVGYALGGGVGWYARKLGLAANSVTAVELVTADGQLRRVDHRHDAELFWALRGGGGSFGIVTALELQLYAIPEVYAGVLFFPWERSSEVLHAWNEWMPTLPDEVASVGRILQFPPLPQVPEPMRGRSFVVVEAVSMTDEATGSELLHPLRELEPDLDTFAMVPPVGISELHMDPPDPIPSTGHSMMLGALPGHAIDAFVGAVGPSSGSTLVSVEIRQLGGALSRSAEGYGALATLDAPFLTYGVGLVMDEESQRANRAHLDAMSEALAPYDSGRQFLNFVEAPTDVSRFYRPETYARLRDVKASVDPAGLLRANHPIGG